MMPSMPLLALLIAAAELRIGHEGLRCVVAERTTVLAARLDPAEAVGRARVYFRAEGRLHWHYVEMAPEGGGFRARLPRPLRTTTHIAYYLEALDRSFSTSRTREFTPVVASGPGACRDEAAAVPLAAGPLVVGAEPGAPPLPEGFLSDGLVPAAGRPAASAPATSAAGGGGPGTLLWIGGVAAVGAAGAVVAVASRGDDAPGDPGGAPSALGRDDDGDGLSEEGGDCNDADPAVRPGGGFDFTVSFPHTGSVSCRTTPAWVYPVRIANLGCNPLNYTLIYQQQVVGLAPESEGRTTGTVAAGATESRTLFGDPAQSLLCCRTTCTSLSLDLQESWTIETALGNRTASNAVRFDRASCPVCGE
jgi:hypothetical protein